MDQLVLSVKTADVAVRNTFNEFMMLSHKQFVENVNNQLIAIIFKRVNNFNYFFLFFYKSGFMMKMLQRRKKHLKKKRIKN